MLLVLPVMPIAAATGATVGAGAATVAVGAAVVGTVAVVGLVAWAASN